MTVVKDEGIPVFLAAGTDSGENSCIQIWNFQTFKIHQILQSHSAAVVALISMDDGGTLLSGSYDKKVLVWNEDQVV
jgi:F-box/WD-40 domain protein 7